MALSMSPSSSFISTNKETNSTIENNKFPSSLTIPSNSTSSSPKSVRIHTCVHAQARAQHVLHDQLSSSSSHVESNSKVPVYVMLPLDTVSPTGSGMLTRARAMHASLMALKSAGVEGVMVDVWWGLVEKEGPLQYDWGAYVELVDIVSTYGLKLQMVMSFHQCGGNVGDSCSINLPPWVQEEMRSNPDILYTDKSGRRNPEYISLGCDMLPVLKGRTPIQVYSDYMRSFCNRFKEYLGTVIVEMQVGLGPCGELRYPSYPESNGTWKFPGIGEFQCYDKYMQASLQASAVSSKQQNWNQGGPHDSGSYNQFPEETGFFKREGTWSTDYGRFFLHWYSTKLIEHGDAILRSAHAIFQGSGIKLSAKVAGIHWHYKTRSHAAELTAGYYNTRSRDGYVPIAQMLAKRGVVLNFTCMEMRDEEQPGNGNCGPELLFRQVKEAAKVAGVELAGENALERYDESAYLQVVNASRESEEIGLSGFTYLRLSKKLFEGENWRNFVGFVKSMNEGGRRMKLPLVDTSWSDLYVGFDKSREPGFTGKM